MYMDPRNCSALITYFPKIIGQLVQVKEERGGEERGEGRGEGEERGGERRGEKGEEEREGKERGASDVHGPPELLSKYHLLPEDYWAAYAGKRGEERREGEREGGRERGRERVWGERREGERGERGERGEPQLYMDLQNCSALVTYFPTIIGQLVQVKEKRGEEGGGGKGRGEREGRRAKGMVERERGESCQETSVEMAKTTV